MTLGKYRAIDLFILALIMCGLDAICFYGLVRFSPIFTISVTTIILLIVFMRWDIWGMINAVIGGLFVGFFPNYLLGTTDMIQPLVIYGLGNLFLIIVVVYIKLVGKNKITQGNWYLVLYAFIGFISVALGRSIIAIFFGNNFFSYFTKQIVAESLNFVFAIIILFITNKQENMFRDQKEYFLEVRGRR